MGYFFGPLHGVTLLIDVGKLCVVVTISNILTRCHRVKRNLVSELIIICVCHQSVYPSLRFRDVCSQIDKTLRLVHGLLTDAMDEDTERKLCSTRFWGICSLSSVVIFDHPFLMYT